MKNVPITLEQAYELVNQGVSLGLTPQHINAIRSLSEQVATLTIARDVAIESAGVYRIMCEEAKPLLAERDTLKAEVLKLRSQCEGAEIVRAEAVKIATECKADAGRYRFARDCNSDSICILKITGCDADESTVLTGDDADEEIDAAMQSAKDAA